MSDQMANEGQGIADAIAEFMLKSSDDGVMSIVGGFTIIAEIIDPETGMQGLFTLQDVALPPWTEYGMLMSRISEITSEMQMQIMGEVHEEWDDD